MKGIILAGGSGTRLYPITMAISKQLMPIYDKPMIYYPLSVLMQAGIKDILIITTKEDQPDFKKLLKDGSQFGINLEYIIQPSPDGLAQAFLLGEEFIGDDSCAMILGDNVYFGNGLEEMLESAKQHAENGMATIFGYQVHDPQRFGIMEINESESGTYVVSVEEKPKEPKSDYAITGLYFYPKGVSEMAKKVKPSARGELEITTLNDLYLKEKKLRAELLGEGFTWFDTGTFDSMMEASTMIQLVQRNSGKIIASPDLIAYEHKFITKEKLKDTAEVMKKNSYGQYLGKYIKKQER